MKIIGLLPLLLLLSACSITGYGGKKTFNCNQNNSSDPACLSISSNYRASITGELGEKIKKDAKGFLGSAAVKELISTPVLNSGMPIRTEAEIARIWVAPYLDADGDLVDQNYTYVTLNQGRWLIEHNQQQIMDEYRPIRLLGTQKGRNDVANSSKGQKQSDQVPNIGLNIKNLSQPSIAQ